MNNWIAITLTIINITSVVSLVFFMREIKGVIHAQTHVIGEENMEVVYPPRLKAFLIIYVFIVILLAVLSYPLLWMSS